MAIPTAHPACRGSRTGHDEHFPQGEVGRAAGKMSLYFIDAMFSLSDLPVVGSISAPSVRCGGRVEVAVDRTPVCAGSRVPAEAPIRRGRPTSRALAITWFRNRPAIHQATKNRTLTTPEPCGPSNAVWVGVVAEGRAKPGGGAGECPNLAESLGAAVHIVSGINRAGGHCDVGNARLMVTGVV